MKMHGSLDTCTMYRVSFRKYHKGGAKQNIEKNLGGD